MDQRDFPDGPPGHEAADPVFFNFPGTLARQVAADGLATQVETLELIPPDFEQFPALEAGF